MVFEYDQEKSAANKQKHGIDFPEAQAFWEDKKLLRIQSAKLGEPRFIVIGMIEEKHWAAVITYRSENIRLISARRARPDEIEAYDEGI